MLNGFEIITNVAEQKPLVFDLAAGLVAREELVTWLGNHITRS
ncbi:MAG: hypothetical protein GFH27_549289n136 [Chloroflexi bacterium AL-W]|nr:hypothetical protein [Chloroflexi bacterium AL-N1]NOK66868.1 hypothetical protein [Chloroflexi bacterium AL-N10]NOK74840.1 hypothetical protein [Chloroflexi bacterium AL-N5]NOK81471.1 hypothetical protein [Chloroflexi bacterium AL-W]NOK88940.1 hypothetical protein [Chloroflexi bacterium AL-N15]